MAELPISLGNLLLRTYRLLEDSLVLDALASTVAATPASGEITFTVNDGSLWSPSSRMEIDGEVFLVKTVNGNDLTVQRAYESTFAAAHSIGAIVRRDPRYLRETVKEAINVTLNDWCSYWFPRLDWDTTTAGNFNPIRWIYATPADATGVQRVVWQIPGFVRYSDIGHSGLRTYPTSEVSTGKGVEITEQGLPGRPVKILYEHPWPFLAVDSDELPADFPFEGDDLIPSGAALYVSGWRQVPKFRLDEISFQRELGQSTPPTFGVGWLARLHNEWVDRAKMVRTRRPNTQEPQKRWAGLNWSSGL